MKHLISCSLTCLLFIHQSFAQDTSAVAFAHLNAPLNINNSSTTVKLAPGNSPYKTKLWVDGPIIIAGVGLTALGVQLINQKDNLTMSELALRTPDRVPFFDRSSAGFYSEKADRDSYVPFKISFALPIAMALINKNERNSFGQVMVLYTETMAITGTLFTMAAGNIQRSRPYVYGTNTDIERRLDKNSQRSFFAGHTAATAAATFFTAKTFADFNPDSKAKVYVWIVAASVPALVGYLRYKAGMHFLSDNLLGYGIGAATGILVPHFHKQWKIKNMTMVPEIGSNYRGVAVTYKLN